MTGAFQEKKNVTENSAFDLADIVTRLKIFCELTREEKYYYIKKDYCPADQNLLSKKIVYQRRRN